MQISHHFRPGAASDLMDGRVEQLEVQLALYQKALGHDLPNQMVSLQGLARMLETELGTGAAPELRNLAHRLAVLARQADEQMRQLAALGRLLRPQGLPQPLDLAELAREAATEVKLLFPGQPVEYHYPQGMPVVMGHRTPLYQIVFQLLRNAFQAAVPGRPLIVEVGARRAAPGGFELWVADNGRGMSAAQLEQVRAVLAGNPAGTTGLGLLSVRQLAAGWQGAVSVRSEPEQGTTVTVLVRTPELRIEN